jgi:hypothetical protein
VRKGFVLSKTRWVPGIIGLALLALCLGFGGCRSYAQPGETALERKVRHNRLLRANYYQMVEDIDKLLMLDKPSTLSDKHMP